MGRRIFRRITLSAVRRRLRSSTVRLRCKDLSEGGIFGALWEMADGAGIGLDVALKRIPIQQETVEICEFFGVNPYQMLSDGGAAGCGGGRRGAGAENGTRRDSIGGDWADDIREGEDSPERGRGPVSG